MMGQIPLLYFRRRGVVLLAVFFVEVPFAAEPRISDAQTAEAAGMVSIQALVPDIRMEMRYASDENFVGKRVRGYEAARCYLLKPTAEALQRVDRRPVDPQKSRRVLASGGSWTEASMPDQPNEQRERERRERQADRAREAEDQPKPPQPGPDDQQQEIQRGQQPQNLHHEDNAEGAQPKR